MPQTQPVVESARHADYEIGAAKILADLNFVIFGQGEACAFRVNRLRKDGQRSNHNRLPTAGEVLLKIERRLEPDNFQPPHRRCFTGS